MQLCLHREASSKQENYWSRGCLMESEKSLQVCFKMLINNVFLLAGQDHTCQPRQQDGCSKDSLHPDGCCRVCSVSFGCARVKESKNSFSVGSETSSNIKTISIWRTHDSNMRGLGGWCDVMLIYSYSGARELHLSLNLSQFCVEN